MISATCVLCLQELWESNVTASCSLQVLQILEKFSDKAGEQAVATDYASMSCLTSPLAALLSHPQVCRHAGEQQVDASMQGRQAGFPLLVCVSLRSPSSVPPVPPSSLYLST